MSIKNKIKNIPDLGYWYFGIMILFTGLIMSQYWFDINLKLKIQEKIPYDQVYYLLQLMIFCMAIIYLSNPISEIISNNKKLQNWYAEYQDKKWRNIKLVV